MNSTEIASGQQRSWNLVRKLAEGDAGEVYHVESVFDRSTAILKRPQRSGFPTDIARQAAQIEKESKILNLLKTLDLTQENVKIPHIIDQSEPGTGLTDGFFIVTSVAEGFDLDILSRAHRSVDDELLQNYSQIPEQLTSTEKIFIHKLGVLGKLPNLLLLRILIALIKFLETIHQLDVTISGYKIHGIIWNDFKPEHLFWEPLSNILTIIDWGNGQFLERNGYSGDRQYSPFNDYDQLLVEMGKYLSHNSPILFNNLSWPEIKPGDGKMTELISSLKTRLSYQLEIENKNLAQARLEELEILNKDQAEPSDYDRLITSHNQIYSHGEIPNYQGAEDFIKKLSRQLILQNNLEVLSSLIDSVVQDIASQSETFQILSEAIHLPRISENSQSALLNVLDNDWTEALWEFQKISPPDEKLAEWKQINTRIREFIIGDDIITPLVSLNRLILTLQASKQTSPTDAEVEANTTLSTLLSHLQEEILPRWIQFDPDPPNSSLAYDDIEFYQDQITKVSPTAGNTLFKSLVQPQSQVRIVLDAWEAREFSTARRGLRLILLWDPDRKRVLHADQNLEIVEDWLIEMAQGPRKDEPLQDCVTRMELKGREFRNYIGPATWLNEIINTLRDLRKGDDPTDVLMRHPSTRHQFGWLLELDPERPILNLKDKQISITRRRVISEIEPTSLGIKKGLFGKNEELAFAEPLDNWVPEAIGSSARVFSGFFQSNKVEPLNVAIKLMRPDRYDYSLPLFKEEVRILSLLRDTNGVWPMLESGFIWMNNPQILMEEEIDRIAFDISGEFYRYGLDSTHNFLADIRPRVEQGWLPYIALPRLDYHDNLLMLCDTSYNNGRFLPILPAMRMAIQICDILEIAHSRNIIYRDHKILHYYWLAAQNGIFMIDWNIAKRFPGGLSDADKQFDLVQFGARTLHHILTGRPAPGALPLGPNRKEEIESAAQSYSPEWTYDDKRLPNDVKVILERSLSGVYKDARLLREDLIIIFKHLSELIKNDSPREKEGK